MRVEFAEGFEEDLDRIREHLTSHGANVEARFAEIFDALKILRRNPYIGYEVESGLRELVIGDKRRHRGYLVLYDVYEVADDVADDEENEPEGLVVVNAIRSQHESGYH
jgi:plasmid stabilization system protein ParE